MDKKIIIGALEKISINGYEVIAKMDTGASRSSIDVNLALQLKLGPIVKKSTIVSAHGKSIRPVIKAKIKIGGKTINALFNISTRSHLKYRVLIGRSILKMGFLVDPAKENI